MIYLKLGLGAICCLLVLDLSYLIYQWFPQWNLKIIVVSLILFVLPCLTFNTIFPVFYFHFFSILVLTQLVFFLVHHPMKVWALLIPFVFTLAILAYGVINLRHVQETNYTLTTNKNIADTKIIYLADFHYPTGMREKDLNNLILRLKDEKPDFYVLGGDIVDEFTTKEEMLHLTKQLGILTQVAPVYYVFGNHDNQHYNTHPVFSKEDLKNELEKNSIQVLADEEIQFQNIQIIGREDAEEKSRKNIPELFGSQDSDMYTIVLDHQPTDLEDCQSYGIDLQLSGHTHNGQIFPLGLFASLVHANEHDYGQRKLGNFTQITTSGISGWGFPVRTQGKSEYVTIEITSN